MQDIQHSQTAAGTLTNGSVDDLQWLTDRGGAEPIRTGSRVRRDSDGQKMFVEHIANGIAHCLWYEGSRALCEEIAVQQLTAV